MKKIPQLTWVKFLKWVIDREWYSSPLAHLSHKKRFERLYMDDWKRLLKKGEFESNGYRRSVWIRLLKQKKENLNRVRREKDGHVAAWILK